MNVVGKKHRMHPVSPCKLKELVMELIKEVSIITLLH